MKKILLLVIIMFGLFGCAKSSVPEELLGLYEDINSDRTLEVKKDTIVISLYDYKEVYKYIYEDGKLMPKESFGEMSDLRVDKGHLKAEEMVLDARGHSYDFVRPEEKKEALQIKDKSKNLPKQIESHDIKEFSLCFEKDQRDVYALGDKWPDMSYSIRLKKEEDTYIFEYHESGDSFIGRFGELELTKEYVDGLDELIRSLSIIENNGYYFENETAHKNYSLNIVYDSDEEVSIRANGDAADTMPFDLGALMEYFESVIIRLNY